MYVCIEFKIMEKLNTEKLEKVAFVLKTIGHPVRLAIINHLAINEKMSVNEICEALGLEQSLISHHLNNMKLKGVLDCDKEGNSRYYFVVLEEVLTVINCMEKCKL
ncbi:MAG: transcriptional regulator [Flavobacteriales bacterium]|nr:MAG: transcriptional regulator [Flavobacteriales bacterium]